MEKYLIRQSDIKEEMRLIKGSTTDYITPTGKVYKMYKRGFLFPKKNCINPYNGYVYCGISYPTKRITKRVHVLVAECYIPNPHNYPIVMHIDNNKTNISVDNLCWGTQSQNTKMAYQDGLIKNTRGWNDSQSIPVCVFDANKKLLDICGSINETANKYNITKAAIRYACNHNIKQNQEKDFIIDIYLNTN